MSAPLRIDFVSDVSCPWCAIGLGGLQQALRNLEGEVQVDLHFQPFELNPKMAAEGEDVIEHIARKYGRTLQQAEQAQEVLRERGDAVGFVFNTEGRRRIYNTFDAHRLLHWAETEGLQAELKAALFKAYFTDLKDLSDHAVLAQVAADTGLDAQRAAQILASDEFAEAVRAQEQFYLSNGINSVPAVIINNRHLISGGQPAEVFEQALRQISASAPA